MHGVGSQQQVESPEQARSLLVLARIGYASKGIVLVTLGLLAARGAVRVGDHTAPLPVEERAAVRAIGHAPLGLWLVGALSLGLLCYAGWQGARAILDTDHAGRRLGGLIRRGWLLWLALLNLALAASAGALAVGLLRQTRVARGSRVDRPAWNLTDTVAGIVASPPARHVLIALGVVSFGYGTVRATQAILGWSHRLRGVSHSSRLQRWRRRAARVHLAGRGAITILLGVALVLGGLFNSGRDLRQLYGWYENEIHGQFGRPALITAAVILLGWGTFDGLRVFHPVTRFRQRLRTTANA